MRYPEATAIAEMIATKMQQVTKNISVYEFKKNSGKNVAGTSYTGTSKEAIREDIRGMRRDLQALSEMICA